MNRNFILSCFGLEEAKLSSCNEVFNEEDNVITYYIEFLRNTSYCPFCGSTHLNVKGYYYPCLNGSILHNMKVFLRPKIRRYLCMCCKKTFKENVNISPFKKRISEKVIENIKIDLCKKLTYTFIASEYNVSVTNVINIFDSMDDIPRHQLPKVMCVDEFKFVNDARHKSRYPFVISEPFTSRIIDIVEYRTKDVLVDYFTKIPAFQRNFVEFYVTDMNETYRYIHKKFFPNSIHIVDHFHISELFTSQLQSLRIRIMKENMNEYNMEEYKCLKKNWRYFLMRKHKALSILVDENGMCEDIYFKIERMFRHYPAFSYLYNSREEFFDVMVKMKDYEETEQWMDFFIQKFADSTIPELRSIGRSFINWKTEIINAYAKNKYRFCLTNAVAEANNKNIKSLINIANGYTNFSRFRKRVLYIDAFKHIKKE